MKWRVILQVRGEYGPSSIVRYFSSREQAREYKRAQLFPEDWVVLYNKGTP